MSSVRNLASREDGAKDLEVCFRPLFHLEPSMATNFPQLQLNKRVECVGVLRIHWHDETNEWHHGMAMIRLVESRDKLARQTETMNKVGKMKKVRSKNHKTTSSAYKRCNNKSLKASLKIRL